MGQPRQLPSGAAHEQQLGEEVAQWPLQLEKDPRLFSPLTHLPAHSPHFGPHTC